jgi:hypothetical protein
MATKKTMSAWEMGTRLGYVEATLTWHMRHHPVDAARAEQRAIERGEKPMVWGSVEQMMDSLEHELKERGLPMDAVTPARRRFERDFLEAYTSSYCFKLHQSEREERQATAAS